MAEARALGSTMSSSLMDCSISGGGKVLRCVAVRMTSNVSCNVSLMMISGLNFNWRPHILIVGSPRIVLTVMPLPSATASNIFLPLISW